MSKMTRFLFAAAVTSLCALATAQEYTLAHKPKVNDTLTFLMVIDLEFVGKTKATMTGKSIEKVLKVEEDGTYTVEVSNKDTVIDTDGEALPGRAEEPPVMKTFKANGDVVQLKGTRIGSSEYRLSNMNAFRLPDKAVKVGDSWTRDIPADTKTGMVPAKATYTIEALDKVGEIDALKVKYTYAEGSGQIPASATGYMWINPADATLLKSDLTLTNVPSSQAGVLINAKVNVTRQ
jgi:hypothetical protein